MHVHHGLEAGASFTATRHASCRSLPKCVSVRYVVVEVDRVARAREEERHREIRSSTGRSGYGFCSSRGFPSPPPSAPSSAHAVEREPAVIDASEALAEPEEVLVVPERERERRLVPAPIRSLPTWSRA